MVVRTLGRLAIRAGHRQTRDRHRLAPQKASVCFGHGLLFGVSPTDLTTFAGVTLVLTTVALAASYIPALRAMRLDPITTIRTE